MNRKEFLKKAALATVAINGFSLVDVFTGSNATPLPASSLNLDNLASVSAELEREFRELKNWLTNNGWADFIKRELGADLTRTDDALKDELIKDRTSDPQLTSLKIKGKGFDDCAGIRLIEPGNPGLSLLYHAMASPRVKPGGIVSYPAIKQLDTLENYIYALKKWEHYGIENNAEYVLAVFAYEYRPAFKTPHHQHADMVYSRTGIGRVGDMSVNYDSANRCYTNKPKTEEDPTGKHIAVMPARYGLFVAKKVKKDDLALRTMGKYKGNDNSRDVFDDRSDCNNYFLLPVRKIFNNDLQLAGASVVFSEQHINEKISILSQNASLKRDSTTLIYKDGILESNGSSFLVISKPQPLIRLVKDGKYKIDKTPTNRYFTSYSEKDPEGGFEIELIAGDENPYYRLINDYKAGRNKPMYVHMARQIKNGKIEVIPKTDLRQSTPTNKTFEDIISRGGYFVPIYEDSICDGAVTANIVGLKDNKLNGISNLKVYPAFSIITAPDFFPYVDQYDIMQFDVAPGVSDESNFYEGGVASLASSRIRPNPKLTTPGNNDSAFSYKNNSDTLANTLTAVVASIGRGTTKHWNNDYESSSYLPDVCSSVFAPGWDITYANKMTGDKEVATYLSTQGLGAPFIEDMKLCAASNGMWAVACPDAARVFQGTVTEYDGDPKSKRSWYANPTAIPLLDEEIGFHENSYARVSTRGWDGEQGPFLQLIDTQDKKGKKWHVNFTDLGRADYIKNCLEEGFDMSKLRELRSSELTSRMDALRRCIQKMKSGSVATTATWLVSAEKMKNGTFEGNGIPPNLIGTDKKWAITPQLKIATEENCYMYLFVDFDQDENNNSRYWAEKGTNVKRRWILCNSIFLFQVSDKEIKGCTVMFKGSKVKNVKWDNWDLI